MKPPVKPFDSFKWRWLSVAPTEGLLNAAVFLGVLRVFARHEGVAPSDAAVLDDLERVQNDTKTTVNLARTGERNLVRNSGQYWKGTGLLLPSKGVIELSPLGRKIASGKITRTDFAAIIIQQTVLPNNRTFSPQEVERWREAGLEIRPFEVILCVIRDLWRQGGRRSAYITNAELVEIVIPLSGQGSPSADMAMAVIAFREGKLSTADWPNCAPAANDRRLANEFLLFLANFDVLRRVPGTGRDDARFVMDEFIASEALKVETKASIFNEEEEASEAVDAALSSALPEFVERQRTTVSVLARRGQARFRASVFGHSKTRCLISDETIPQVLEAAHVIPVGEGGSDDVSNGLCLRVDLHRLFDAGGIRIRSTGVIELSDTVSKSVVYSHLPKAIAIPAYVDQEKLNWRYDYL